MAKVLITGAGGFVGQKLCLLLEKNGFEVLPVFRVTPAENEGSARDTSIKKLIDSSTDWTSELVGVDVVIHLAAMVHVMKGSATADIARFREHNVEGTRNLAQQAAKMGVGRFIYLSSVKVNGERTEEKPFTNVQPPRPEGAYAVSKMEAEKALRKIEEASEMGVVIIRPPLVYGPGVKGNLAALTNAVRKGLPLPLGGIRNRRDLVSIYNLCDLVRICCVSTAAPGETFLVCDGESISTPQLVRHIANGVDRKARLYSMPLSLLKLSAVLLRRPGIVARLSENLQIDMSATRETLDWTPPFSVEDSFRRMFAER